MEYTDAPTQIAATMTCPQCGRELAADAQVCQDCGWRRENPDTAEGKASDAFAVLLSIVPGLGHIYKGHTMMGLLLVFVATPMAIILALLAATATAGFAVLLLPLYWIGVMFHVYGIEDRVGPAKADEGEQY
ncbi:MAG: hypothetical protein ACR2FX_02515 [Chthoniobacterales bacterium]